MIHYQLPGLARQHLAELRHEVGAEPRRRETVDKGPSLRVRAGWTLVGIGLRLAARPASRHAWG